MEGLAGVSLSTASSEGDGSRSSGVASLLGQGPSEITISGPDAQRLQDLAEELGRLLSESEQGISQHT